MDKEFLAQCLIHGETLRSISQVTGKSKETVRYWIKKYELDDLYHKPKYPPVSFNKIDTPEKAYCLGLILADGSIDSMCRVEMSVALEDRHLVDFCVEQFGGQCRIDTAFDKQKRRFPRARWNRKISDILTYTGGSAKEDRHYPRIRADLERYLIQGVFDADGCITWGLRKDRNRLWHKVSFTSQYSILYGVQQYLLKRLKIATSIRPKTGEKCFVLDFANKDDVLKFYHHIYDNNDMVVLQRKYLKFRALRLELGENGGSDELSLYRAAPAEQEGVETSGDVAIHLNNRISTQGQCVYAG